MATAATISVSACVGQTHGIDEGFTIHGIRFKRSPERRTAKVVRGANRRRQERRSPSIAWIPLFRYTDESAICAALGDSEVLVLSVGSTLLRPGEANDNVYILLSGNLAAHLDANLNPDAAITMSPGACIGELSAIDGKPVSALVLAQTEARVLKLSKEVFWNRLMTLPGVAGNLLLTLTERMRHASELALNNQREQLELVHLRKELDAARQLQISMLPLQRPIFPERSDIEICGFMEPASHIGGDLFDAFFVDDRQLFFCIGDVSGHGIAASLFMARTIGLLRILAMNTLAPDKLLESLNERLCVGNETCLFVTLFCGFLDVDSGRLRYSNGGHCAPILAAGGRVDTLGIPKGPLVGAFPGVGYACMERQLDPGDVLFCYTDGVTEAQVPTGEEFSEHRCLEILARSSGSPLPALLDRVRQEVTDFAGSAWLEDDCTMLVLRRPATGCHQSSSGVSRP